MADALVLLIGAENDGIHWANTADEAVDWILAQLGIHEPGAGDHLVSGQVMTHIRSESKTSSKHKIADCRKGRHDYEQGQHIGAGIMRRVCQTCAYVTIDLSGVEDDFRAHPPLS